MTRIAGIKGTGLTMNRAEFRLPVSADLPGLPPAKGMALGFALFATMIGALGLSGWAFDSDLLRRDLAEFSTINPATAVALILAGASIALAARERRTAASVIGLLVAAIGMAKLVDLAFGGFPVDRLLFRDLLDTAIVPRPSHMAPNTAAALLMTGLALVLVNRSWRQAKIVAQLFALWAGLMAVFAIVGYVSGVVHFRRVDGYLPMAVATALGLAVSALGILALTRQVGLALIARDQGPAGAMLRTTFPLILAIPLAVGVLRLWGEQKGLYSAQAGIALQIMSSVVVTSTLLMVSMIALYRSDLARRERERQLADSERFNRLVASANPDCISLLDADYNILFGNAALVRTLGLNDVAELVGEPFGHRLDSVSRIDCEAALRAAQVGGSGRFSVCVPDSETGEARWLDTMISKLPADRDQPFRYLVISRDISEKREIEDQVRWKASHDDLTQLPNRAQFQAHLERHVRQVGQEGFALFVLDIDNFKLVNDTLGHDAGDRLLKTVAERIGKAVRHGDIVARLAGDEFAVIARNVRTEPGAVVLAERIFDSLREPWLYHGRLGECRVSIGASLAPRHGDDAEELFKHADIALYEAKSRGKGQIAVFRPNMKAALERRTRQISLARHALNSNLVVPYYQPKVELATGRVAGFEALLRWRHPTQGIQMPATILAAFEDLELASEITERMTDRVLRDMRGWRSRGIPFGHVAINVTAADLRQDDFAARLLGKLADHGLPPECLQVEITETVFLGRGAEYVERALRSLHDAGIGVALDDFGTGYASLSHLKQFPVDVVKIDRSFLHDFALDPQNQAIINTVISLGQSLDIGIVAEGIETREQERHLLTRGCTYGQGYLYGKAMSALRVPRLLASGARELRRAA
jgi:diguanylate cyclase (GGDEF)-like protein